MSVNRAVCLIALAAATLFHIFFIGYFSFFLLVFILMIILASVLASLPGALGLHAHLRAKEERVRRGQALKLTLDVENSSHFTVPCAIMELCVTNALSGEEEKETIRLPLLRGMRRIERTVVARHCGLIRCELKRIRSYDLLGLFALPRGAMLPQLALCLPQTMRFTHSGDTLADASVSQGDDSRRNTAAIPETYDVRAYRPGDAMHHVHWKLSAKLDELMMREAADHPADTILLLLDYFGHVDEMDKKLAYVDAFAEEMIAARHPFGVEWFDPKANAFVIHAIQDGNELSRFYYELLSTRLPESGRSIRAYREAGKNAQSPIRLFYAEADGIRDLADGQLLGGGGA